MGLCIDLGYEVVTDTVTVGQTPPDTIEFRLTAPSGKKPVGGGVKFPSVSNYSELRASYPDGDDWVFVVRRTSGNTYDIDIYAVFVNV